MFKELFYWMYVFIKKIKTNDTPAFSAVILICFCQLFNITTLLILANYFLKINVHRTYIAYIPICLTIFLFLINYLSLYQKREIIIEAYGNKSHTRNTYGQIFFWIYVIGSVFIFYEVAIELS